MSQSEARSWWADVEHLRESMERRGGADLRAVEPPADREVAGGPKPLRPRSRFAAEPWLGDSDLDLRPASRFKRSTATLDEAPTAVDDWLDEPTARTLDVWLEGGGPGRTGRFDRASGAGTSERADVEPEATPALTALPGALDEAASPAPTRRTVRITGHTTPASALPRLVAIDRRRPLRRPSDRVGPRPDRVALWAVMLAFFLILVAALSSAAG